MFSTETLFNKSIFSKLQLTYVLLVKLKLIWSFTSTPKTSALILLFSKKSIKCLLTNPENPVIKNLSLLLIYFKSATKISIQNKIKIALKMLINIFKLNLKKHPIFAKSICYICSQARIVE